MAELSNRYQFLSADGKLRVSFVAQPFEVGQLDRAIGYTWGVVAVGTAGAAGTGLLLQEIGGKTALHLFSELSAAAMSIHPAIGTTVYFPHALPPVIYHSTRFAIPYILIGK